MKFWLCIKISSASSISLDISLISWRGILEDISLADRSTICVNLPVASLNGYAFMITSNRFRFIFHPRLVSIEFNVGWCISSSEATTSLSLSTGRLKSASSITWDTTCVLVFATSISTIWAFPSRMRVRVFIFKLNLNIQFFMSSPRVFHENQTSFLQ